MKSNARNVGKLMLNISVNLKNRRHIMKYSNPEVQKAFELWRQEKDAEEAGLSIEGFAFWSEARKDIYNRQFPWDKR
jgi:hypothetical protein